MKGSYGIAAVLAILTGAALQGGVAKAATPIIKSQADIFDARADGAASTYCIDAPAVLVGQQICGGFLRSTVTATSDPRGFALGGLAPAPKISSIPLIIPTNFQGIPVPQQVQDGLRQIKFNNIPSQCQAVFPELNIGDADQSCGGPTYGDSALGFIGSDANAHVYTVGDQTNPTQTRTVADSRASRADLTGLQSTYDNVRSIAQSGLSSDGMPTGDARMNASRVSIASGLFIVEGIVSTTKVAFNGTKAGTAANTAFSYTSATLAGIPVDITPNGLKLATDSVPADQVKTMTDQFNKALENANGFSVKLLPAPPIEITDNLARATSGGIQVSYRGSSGTDVTYTQTIGVTSAQVSAVSNSGGAGAASDTAADGGASPVAAGGPAGSAGVAPQSIAGDVSGRSADVGAPAATVAVSGADSPAPGADPGVGTASAQAAPAGGDVIPTAADSSSGTTAAAPPTQVVRAIGDQALLADFPTAAEPLSSSRLQDIYPIFGLLLLAALVATRFRRVSFSKQAG